MWNEINTAADIEALLIQYAGFHDSCIVSVNYNSGATVDANGTMTYGGIIGHTVNMILHSQWKGRIELRFTGVRKCNIVGWQDNYFCDIFDAHIAFHTDLLGATRDDRLIVWADCAGFKPEKYTEEKIISPSGRNYTYIVAEKMFWKMLTETE